jgi:hypothetical protein
MTEEQLKQFCAVEPDRRFHLPWVEAGWRYYCNGRIGVRLPTTDADTPFGGKTPRAPSIEQVFLGYAVEEERPWPTDGLIERNQLCWQCEGCKLYGGESCPNCSGTGEETCPTCNRDHDCQRCSGSGRINRKRCHVCDANPSPREPFLHPICRRVGHHNIGMRLDELIAALPNVRYVRGIPSSKALLFRFDGGEGAVMGMELPEDSE